MELGIGAGPAILPFRLRIISSFLISLTRPTATCSSLGDELSYAFSRLSIMLVEH